MKKLALLFIAAGLIALLSSVCNADSGLQITLGGNTYKIEQASSQNSGFSYKVGQADGALTLSDPATGVDASVRADSLAEGSFDKLREYYSDSKMTKDELFTKYLELKKSYMATMEDYYRVSFLYGDQGDPSSESNMKLFYDGLDRIFGQNSEVYLYNVIQSNKLADEESTHLDLIIPIPGDYTVITINFELAAGKLDSNAIKTINGMLGCLTYNEVHSLSGSLAVLKDDSLTSSVNKGIYPAPDATSGKLSTLQDQDAGYRLKYPESWIPYLQNSIGGKFDYKSFKIDANDIFSVSEEASTAGTGCDAASKPREVKALNKGSMEVADEGNRVLGGLQYLYLKYSLTQNSITTYYKDYYTAIGPALYTLRLSSRYREPDEAVTAEFDGVLSSFKPGQAEGQAVTKNLVPPADGESGVNASKTSKGGMQEYLNSEEGYGFSYPAGWQLKYTSKNIAYDEYKLVLPDLSGPLDIYISEGELSPGLSPDEIPACVAGTGSPDVESHIVKYTPPYQGLSMKLLDADYDIRDSDIYTYRLADYLDANGRNRLAYTTDIVSGTKIYSMFITLGEYKAQDGQINDSNLNSLVNGIISSFRKAEASMPSARKASVEVQNPRLAFVESCLRDRIDPDLKVVSASDYSQDGSFYATVSSGSQSGYYKVKLDYEGRKLEILDRTLKTAILKNEAFKLIEKYTDAFKASLDTSEKDMTITVRAAYVKDAPSITSTYKVNVSFNDSGLSWVTDRADHAGELRKDCQAYLERLTDSKTSITFASRNEFSSIDAYAKTNCPYYALVYTKFSVNSGYFILKIDPSTDMVTATAYKSVNSIPASIADKYGFASSGLAIAGYTLDETGFNITVSFSKKSGQQPANQTFRISLNLETLEIEFDRL